MITMSNHRMLMPVVLALHLALLSGCAESGGASAPEPSSPAAQGDGVRFAECMREHGVDVPDPEDGQGGAVEFTVPRDEDSPTMSAAMDACRKHLPNGGEPPSADPEELAEARRFSECMRENGIEDFPDPEPDGRLLVEGGAVDVDEEFAAAQKACAEHSPALGDESAGAQGHESR